MPSPIRTCRHSPDDCSLPQREDNSSRRGRCQQLSHGWPEASSTGVEGGCALTVLLALTPWVRVYMQQALSLPERLSLGQPPLRCPQHTARLQLLLSISNTVRFHLLVRTCIDFEQQKPNPETPHPPRFSHFQSLKWPVLLYLVTVAVSVCYGATCMIIEQSLVRNVLSRKTKVKPKLFDTK